MLIKTKVRKSQVDVAALRKRLLGGRGPVRKAQPTTGDVHINGPLSNISVAFVQRQEIFIAGKAFPVVPVDFQSNSYYIFDKDSWFRDEAKTRAPATESAGGGFTLSTDSYSCKVEAFHKDVDDQIRANADSVLSLDQAAAEFSMQKLLLRRERKWATSFFTTGVWGADVTPGTLWDAAGSKPRKNVDDQKAAIMLATGGFVPNTLIITPYVKNALRDNADVRDQFKYVSADSIDNEMLARYFGIERILELNAVYNNSIEGAANAMTFIGGKHALLCYSAPSPSLMTPTAGYTFSWSGLVGAGGTGIRTKKFRMENLEADRVECQMATDMKKVAGEMGILFANVVS